MAAPLAAALVGAVVGAVVLSAGLPGAWAATSRSVSRTLAVPLKGLTLQVPVSGRIEYTTRDGRAAVQSTLSGDLSAIQRQSNAVLRALLDRQEACGDRIAVRDGRIGARAPALRVIGTVDYEKAACLGGRQVILIAKAPVFIDMLLYPVVQPRSLTVRTQVLDVRVPAAGIPRGLQPGVRDTFAKAISSHIGELFPAGMVPPGMSLQSLSFEEAKPGRLSARVEAAGSLPQASLERFLRKP